MAHEGQNRRKPESGGAFPGSRSGWDQAAIDKAVGAYLEAHVDREVLFESIWVLVRSEIMLNLKAELKDDVALDRGEMAAMRELRMRLEKGRATFLTRTYVKRYVCGTAIRFARRRRAKSISFDAATSQMTGAEDTAVKPHEQTWLRNADLYFCLERLKESEKRLLHLHHHDGLKLEDAAVKLGISHDAARQRHSRAIRDLKGCLEGQSSGGWF